MSRVHVTNLHASPCACEVNALLGDHLGASRDLTVDTVTRIEQSMKRGSRQAGRRSTEVGWLVQIFEAPLYAILPRFVYRHPHIYS